MKTFETLIMIKGLLLLLLCGCLSSANSSAEDSPFEKKQGQETIRVLAPWTPLKVTESPNSITIECWGKKIYF
jgi:hypothetical protein